MPTSTAVSVTQADAQFFAALLARDIAALESLLDETFVIVEVGSGTVHSRADFLAAVEHGIVVFRTVETDPAEASVREYDGAAIVVGRTAMTIADAEGAVVRAASRYTHVFVQRDGRWRLASAQGTPIAEAA